MTSEPHDVVGALLVRDGRVLLGHRSPDRRWYPDVWDIPGGHVESGETPAAALARELVEELGVHADIPLEPIADAEEGELRLHVYRVDTWRGEPTNRAPEEHDALGWFAADEIVTLALAHPSYPHVIRAALDEAP